MFNWMPGSRRQTRWSWYGFGVTVVAAMATIGLLLLVVSHKDSQFPKATNCPPESVVNRALGTDVSAPTAVSESDLLGCFYQQGSDEQAVSVSFAVPTGSDEPCRRRHRVEVSGDVACDVTGTAGTSRSGASLMVEAGSRQDQFSSDLRRISRARLEELAVKVLAAPPPPVHGAGASSGPALGVGAS